MLSYFKKILSLILAGSLIMILFSGCATAPDVSAGDSSVSDGEQTGIIVKAKKYAYQEADVMILHVENRSEKNYIIRVTGHYMDENGNELKSETKKFDDFAAGYKNYFVFQPSIKFDSFNYEITTEAYPYKSLSEYLIVPNKLVFLTGEVWLDDNGNFITHKDFDNYKSYVALWVYMYPFLNTYKEPLRVSGYFVMFDSKGEIYMIEYVHSNAFSHTSPDTGPVYRCYISDVPIENKDQFEIPKNLKNATGLFAVTSVSTFEHWD